MNGLIPCAEDISRADNIPSFSRHEKSTSFQQEGFSRLNSERKKNSVRASRNCPHNCPQLPPCVKDISPDEDFPRFSIFWSTRVVFSKRSMYEHRGLTQRICHSWSGGFSHAERYLSLFLTRRMVGSPYFPTNGKHTNLHPRFPRKIIPAARYFSLLDTDLSSPNVKTRTLPSTVINHSILNTRPSPSRNPR